MVPSEREANSDLEHLRDLLDACPEHTECCVACERCHIAGASSPNARLISFYFTYALRVDIHSPV